MLHPQMREAMGEARPLDKPLKDTNKVQYSKTCKKKLVLFKKACHLEIL